MVKQRQQQADPDVIAEISGLQIEGECIRMVLSPRHFKSGNSGWWNQQRHELLDGSAVSIQVTIVHKPAK